MRIRTVDILTFDGFFDAKFDILKPRWLRHRGLLFRHGFYLSLRRIDVAIVVTRVEPIRLKLSTS